jgi:hypothetical protein
MQPVGLPTCIAYSAIAGWYALCIQPVVLVQRVYTVRDCYESNMFYSQQPNIQPVVGLQQIKYAFTRCNRLHDRWPTLGPYP